MKNKKIYMIGVKGVGMTMLAQFLQALGNSIIGSDIEDSFMTDKVLKNNKIKVNSPFAVKNIPEDSDMVIYSSAFNAKNNLEMEYLAKTAKMPMFSYAQALGEVFNLHKGIAVCGSHGKTTVSAWLGYVLEKSGLSPNVLVGSSVPQFKGNTLIGNSRLLVAEADEYQNKLQYLNPYGVLLNNIDYDHPDFFKTRRDYVDTFKAFVKRIPANGFLVANHRDSDVWSISKKLKAQVISYDIDDRGYNGEIVNYLAHNIRVDSKRQIFSVNNLGDFKISLFGRHNIFNALAVIATCRELKVPIYKLKKYLAMYQGASRRFQYLGEYRGAKIIDDYAHHPSEVKATITALQEKYPNSYLRIVFHPHTYTRTKALFKDFVKSFVGVGELIILDIYGSAREEQGGVSSVELLKEIRVYNKQKKANQKLKHVKGIDEAAKYLKQTVKKDEVILLMGAGDVFRVADILLKNKSKK